MASYPGVPISIIAAGGTPIAIIGDQLWTGPLIVGIASTANSITNSFWSANMHGGDYAHYSLVQVSHFNDFPAVTVGKRWVDVTNSQIPNTGPLTPDPTAIGGPSGPILFTMYGNESSNNITVLLNDLVTTHNNPSDGGAYGLLKSQCGMAFVYFAPLGGALAAGTGDGNFNNLVNAADGLLFQCQRQGQFTLSLSAFISGLTPTVTAIRAGTTKPLLMQVQTYNPNQQDQLMDITQLVQIINAVGNAFHPAGISLWYAGAANQAASTALAQNVINYYRP